MAVTIVQQHSIGHLFYAVMLAGLLQIAFGALGLSARLLRLLPSMTPKKDSIQSWARRLSLKWYCVAMARLEGLPEIAVVDGATG